MPPQKRREDEKLTNGSIIFWSRRKDPYVCVRCVQCGRDRLILLNNTTRRSFTGICGNCTRGERWRNQPLENGSTIWWSRRDGQRIPVTCGKCGADHVTHGSNIRKNTFTGLCRRCLHSGPTSTTWRGGRVEKNGYVYVKVDPGHPFFQEMATTTGYIAEHRFMMAIHLKRALKATEVVHHRNGIKTDNRIENLELYVSQKEHGKASQERRPHPGYEPAALQDIVLTRLRDLLSDHE